MNNPIAFRIRASVVGSFALLLAAGVSLLPAPQARGWDEKQGRVAQLSELGKKFDGAEVCAECHAKSKEEAAPAPLMTENATWNTKDKHSTAFKVLKKPRPEDLAKRPALADIGKKLGIAKVDKDVKCLACHTMSVPDKLQGSKYSAREGVSCDSCHGPSETWDALHKNKGWTNEQRTLAAGATKGSEEWPGQLAHKALLKAQGLYDTKPIVARAEICVSCHLSIDAKMVAAGHPQPFFELNKFTADEPPHWRERADEAGLNHTRTWAVGQVVCMRDALLQLAERAGTPADADALKEALTQALSHVAMVQILIDSKAIDGSLDQAAVLKAALADPVAKAKDIQAAATALAGNYSKLVTAAASMKADAAVTTKLLSTVAADATLGKNLGLHGATQQSLAVWSLYNAMPSAKEGDAANKSIKSLVESVGSYGGPYDAGKFAAALSGVTAGLPK